MSESWHNLLAAIPKDVRINRRSVLSPALAQEASAAAVAEWESLTIELSDGNAGLRHLMVTLDGNGRAVGASDLVLFRRGLDDGRVEVRTESLGGRIESDGRFFGTRWTAIGHETRGADADTGIESTASTPTDADVDRLLALVKEVIKRRPSRAARAARTRARVGKKGADD
jgi:hypothetical protein